MYISPRAVAVRNALVAVVNGSITLIILLIAPLGLAAVMINTLLVVVATYGVSRFADWVVAGLLPASQGELLPGVRRGNLRRLSDALTPWRRGR